MVVCVTYHRKQALYPKINNDIMPWHHARLTFMVYGNRIMMHIYKEKSCTATDKSPGALHKIRVAQ